MPSILLSVQCPGKLWSYSFWCPPHPMSHLPHTSCWPDLLKEYRMNFKCVHIAHHTICGCMVECYSILCTAVHVLGMILQSQKCFNACICQGRMQGRDIPLLHTPSVALFGLQIPEPRTKDEAILKFPFIISVHVLPSLIIQDLLVCTVQTYIHAYVPAETLTPPGHRVYSVSPCSVSLQNSFQVESVSWGHVNTGGGFRQFSPYSNGHKSS